MSVSQAPLRTSDGVPGRPFVPAHPDLDSAITRSQSYLLSEQRPEGYWVGELMVDVTLVADMVAFLARAGAGSITGQAIPIDGGATARA